jgi:hypothetical protein
LQLIPQTFWIGNWKHPGLEIRENAEGRTDDAELDQRFERPERIGKEFAVIENPRGARAIKHVVRQDLVPKLIDLLGFGEKPVAADVEVKTFISSSTGNSADVNRIGFENSDADLVFRQNISGRKTSWSGTDDGYVCFH